MPRTRIKICGITRNEDALLAARLGADAIGLVFYPPSPRAVTVAQVPEILNAVPALVTVVALFVDPDPDLLRSVLATGRIGCVQLHGEESPEFCASLAVPVLKALRVRDEAVAVQQLERYRVLANILLDSHHGSGPGGTGRTFDWGIARRLVAGDSRHFLLAGGLNADNVGAAIREVRPHGVDVSTGVEARPGIKDAGKLKQFFAAVAAADKLRQDG